MLLPWTAFNHFSPIRLKSNFFQFFPVAEFYVDSGCNSYAAVLTADMPDTSTHCEEDFYLACSQGISLFSFISFISDTDLILHFSIISVRLSSSLSLFCFSPGEIQGSILT